MKPSFDSLKAMVATEIDLYRPYADQNSARGATARGLPALNALRDFYVAEMKRGTSPIAVEAAMLTIMGNMIATMASRREKREEPSAMEMARSLSRYAICVLNDGTGGVRM